MAVWEERAMTKKQVAVKESKDCSLPCSDPDLDDDDDDAALGCFWAAMGNSRCEPSGQRRGWEKMTKKGEK
ncbi:unnamed protein product [Cuscuta campestris]|uniref:Uncharacterized protein n=1 Tax=Cuscuta campestris TaxID=132261 RepID=A0A484KMZ3_9ASTE|nr:unnamed protein product [Cuscuta campestris]